MLTGNLLHSSNKMESLTLESLVSFAKQCGYKYVTWDSQILKIKENGRHTDTDFFLENGLINTKYETNLIDIIDLSVIGIKIKKTSNKPFKSGEKYGFVTAIKINKEDPKESIAYEVDGDTLVNITKCKLY